MQAATLGRFGKFKRTSRGTPLGLGCLPTMRWSLANFAQQHENLFSITKRRKPVLHNAAEWRIRFDGPKLMKLFTVPGVSGLTVTPDIMHTKWLGVDTYLLGSAMAVMLKFKFNSDVDALHQELSRYFGYIYMDFEWT